MRDLEKRYRIGNTDSAKTRSSKGVTTSKFPQLSVKVGIEMRDEFSIQIPRQEVEEIRDVVMKELKEIRPGYISTITGG